MRRFISPLMILALMVSCSRLASAGVSSKVIDRFERSGQVMQEMIDAPDKGIPKGMLDHARCVAVVPSLKKGGFGLGARFGHGFVTCRRGMTGSWGPVSSFKIAGGTFGFQIGLESVDVVLLFVNQRGVERLLEDEFALGGDASVSAGPVGRTAEAGTDISLRSEIYSYARSRGLFAGVSLDGARMYHDGDVNKDLYGREIKVKDILITPKVGMPAHAAHLIGVLNKCSPRAPYVKK
ncbi:MAG TPA: lipid-binding SYLF domain-containing protein [Terriglobales bacterium]|jgi:lipid-binding SYLF domain-containing protein|nr:lipid-binding SYLF domain-containing protein [Terriglobales bacterium]